MKLSYSLSVPKGVQFDYSYNRARIEVNAKFADGHIMFNFYNAKHFDEDLCGILALEMAREYVLRNECKIPFRFIVRRVFTWLMGGALARFASKHEIEPIDPEETSK